MADAWLIRTYLVRGDLTVDAPDGNQEGRYTALCWAESETLEFSLGLDGPVSPRFCHLLGDS